MNGRYGSSLATAYKILVAIGEATEAERLVDIQWAHLSGVNYNTIGDAGARFLENVYSRFLREDGRNDLIFLYSVRAFLSA